VDAWQHILYYLRVRYRLIEHGLDLAGATHISDTNAAETWLQDDQVAAMNPGSDRQEVQTSYLFLCESGSDVLG
jgi:hypothetical protein